MKDKLLKILEDTNANHIDAETALEQVLDLLVVSNSAIKDQEHYDSLLDCCNQLIDGVDVGIYPKRSIMGMKILLNR